ncbi:SPOR domain-containing protein [Crassaminicella thermophila]|uniref:SPOR domain-containing protein n=1 Tax=Crassaminicella thermophila TaxID=2599308 RepID=A0A5C0SCT4_CRATE|nr:SPOR domain-containing protein [Crassaminicella thermophila]QEK12323.1 SPOR domain-containing protein [Crassaminicella thermophila]
MRQSRVKTRKESKGKKFSFIIIFVLLLPGISIMLGYLGTKYVILPNLFQNKIITKEYTSNPKVSNSGNKDFNNQVLQEAYANTFELKGMDIFSIQVGSFTTKENAQILIDELNTKKMGSYLWYNDGYKVLTISMLDRESIDMLLPRIKKEYNEAFVVKINIPTRAIKYGKEDSQYTMLLGDQNARLIKIFKDVSEIIKSSEENSLDIDQRNILVLKNIDNLKDIKAKMKVKVPSKHMQQIHNEFIEIVENFEQMLEGVLKDDEKPIVAIQNALMNELFQYSNFAAKNEY